MVVGCRMVVRMGVCLRVRGCEGAMLEVEWIDFRRKMPLFQVYSIYGIGCVGCRLSGVGCLGCLVVAALRHASAVGGVVWCLGDGYNTIRSLPGEVENKVKKTRTDQ